jgi:adenosylcobyric acid synthase
MARTLLVAGTASHVGKSTVVAGLCRRFADRGVDVAPFKAQNMSNNARAVADGDGGWGEVGVSQYTQARAAGVTPTTDHNPVLLKPRGDGQSQLVFDGEAVGSVGTDDYYGDHWERARETAREAYERLAVGHEVVVAEGAGSIAEINLHDRDLANVETARFADAEILLVADIERGGVFASIYGTLELVPEDVRERIAGVVVSKFRGDRSLLDPGIETIEAETGVPVVAVLPYDDPGLPAEDSLDLPDPDAGGRRGTDDGVPESRSVTIAVPRYPRLSNAPDVDPLAREPGVRVAFRPPAGPLGDPDAVVLPGSKNTVDDLLALRAGGLAAEIAAFEGPVVGLCGGYQMLGERLLDAGVESTSDPRAVRGLGLLPVETRFERSKTVRQSTRAVDGHGPIAGADGTASGYEIHAGETRRLASLPSPLGGESAATDRVLGTYLHGLFENRGVRTAFLDVVYAAAGRERPDAATDRPDPYAAAAELVAPIPLSPGDTSVTSRNA